MKYSLRTKMMASFAATALLCVVLIAVFSNIQMEKHFREYVRLNHEKKNQEILSLITAKVKRDGAWDVRAVQDAGIYAMEQGRIIRVMDAAGNLVWDAYTYNNGLCQQMMREMTRGMMQQNPGWEGDVTQDAYPVTVDGESLGTVLISYIGPDYYDELDVHFVKTLNRVLMGVGLFSLILALMIGMILSRRISMPIVRVIGTAQSISKGTFGDRSLETSTTKEISDLTETVNNLAETLEKQERLRKRLTGDVAHELRTPLATLQSHLEAMIDGIWEPTAERLVSCHEEIARITRLVSDLERLAHYESESLILNITEFEADEFVAKLLQTFETAFDNRQVVPAVDCEAGRLKADRDKLSQVLVNLITNALRFTDVGGRITVSVHYEGQWVRIRVSDTGQGIAPQDLPHVFERFYRADTSRNRSTGGAGIGLTLVKAIVEAHKGTVEVTSEPGVGTTFTVALPR